MLHVAHTHPHEILRSQSRSHTPARLLGLDKSRARQTYLTYGLARSSYVWGTHRDFYLFTYYIYI